MLTHAGNGPLQHTDPWKQHFAVDEMRHSQVKEDRKALLTPPGAGVEPAEETKVFRLGGEILIAILLHDFVDVIVAHLTLAIAGKDAQISNVELRGQCQDDVVRNIRRIGEKRSQKPNSTKLKSEAQARMGMTPRL